MDKMCRHSGDKPGNVLVKMEIVLNAFTGSCYVCKRKGTGLLIVLTKK